MVKSSDGIHCTLFSQRKTLSTIGAVGMQNLKNLLCRFICSRHPVPCCVHPVCVNVCSQVDEILQNHLYGIGHVQSNDARSVLLLLDTDLHFQGQHVGHCIISANISQTLLLPSDKMLCICHPMAPVRILCVVTIFQGHTISVNLIRP